MTRFIIMLAFLLTGFAAHAQQRQPASAADIRVIGSYDDWITLAGNNAAGVPVCGAGTQNQQQVNLTLVLRKGSSDLILIISDPSWQTNPKLEPGTGEKISLNFDGDEYWQTSNVVATPHPIPTRVEITISAKRERESMRVLFGLFDRKTALEIDFVLHEGMKPIAMSMKGSAAAIAKLMECVQRMGGPQRR